MPFETNRRRFYCSNFCLLDQKFLTTTQAYICGFLKIIPDEPMSTPLIYTITAKYKTRKTQQNLTDLFRLWFNNHIQDLRHPVAFFLYGILNIQSPRTIVLILRQPVEHTAHFQARCHRHELFWQNCPHIGCKSFLVNRYEGRVR